MAIELKQLLKAGLLQFSNIPCASPLLPLKKKDGGHRVAMDYLYLNALTKKNSYSLPRIDNSAFPWWLQVFFRLDMASEYWQVDLSPNNCEKCALISSEGLFEPN